MEAPPAGPLPAHRDRSAGVEALFAALTSALLFSLFLLAPWWFWSALILAGIPAVRVAQARGPGYGVVCVLVASAALAGVGAADGGAPAALGTGVGALICFGLPVLAAALTRRGASGSKAYLVLAALGVAAVAAAIALSGGSPEKALGELFEAMKSQPPPKGADSDAAARIAFLAARGRELAVRYYSGVAAFGWVFLSAVWFYAGSHAARPAPSAERVRFEELRIPAAVVALFVAAGAGAVLLQGAAQTAAGDLLLPLLALYFLAGLSIICHFARRWFRSRVLRAGLYFIVGYTPLFLVAGVLGLFDWYVDFRSRGAGEETSVKKEPRS
jgi:hypothetical protein